MISSVLLLLLYMLLIIIGLVGVDVINRKFAHKEIRHKKSIAMIIFLIAYTLLIFSLYYVLSFDGIFSGNTSFGVYVISAFAGLPVAVALTVGAYLLYFRNFSVKSIIVLIVSMLLFSFAASNLHDFIWCAHATDFYTHSRAGGYDLEIWKHILNMPNDYRIFGGFMTLLMLIWLFLGFKFANSFLRNISKTFIFSGIILLGVFLYIIDMAPLYGRLVIISSTAILLPLSIYSFIKAFENVKW